MRVQIREDRWPIYQVTLYGDVDTKDAAEEVANALTAPLQRRQRYVALVDTTLLGRTTHESRAAFSHCLKEREVDFVRFNIGTVIIVRSTLVRGLMASLNLIYRWATPNEFVSNVAEAERVLQGWLVAATIPDYSARE